MPFRVQTMKKAIWQPLILCSLPLIVLFLLFVAPVPYSGAQDNPVATVATVEFAQEAYELTLYPAEEGNVDVELKLNPTEVITSTDTLTVTYVVELDDPLVVVEPWGEQQLGIPIQDASAKISFSITPEQAWEQAETTVTIRLANVIPDDTADIGQRNEVTITIKRNESTIYLPVILNPPPVWELLDGGDVKENARSLAICPNNSSILYLGTDEGLFKWTGSAWEPVQGDVPGSVREIAFGATCDRAYAAVLGDGVWGTNNGQSWSRVGALAPELKSSRTVIVRGDRLYTGTDTGIHYYIPGSGSHGSWTQIDYTKDMVIARLALAGDRIFAGIWEEGVLYNDPCDEDACGWEPIPGPSNDSFVRDVIGRPPQNAGDPPDWLLFATATTVHWWNGKAWASPTVAPQPIGNVFSLAGNDGLHYAGVENGGVWVTDDEGKSWKKLGDLSATVRDIVLLDDKLYVATFDDGVWRWPLP